MREVTPRKTKGYGWKAAEWLLGVFGSVALLLGLFIRFGPKDDYVGLGGDWAWRVGDISPTWMNGLTVMGGVMLATVLSLLVAGRSRVHRPTPRGDLLWHTVVFILVNAYVWAQDFALGTGLDYAYLMTIPWGIGLAAHAMTYFGRKRRDELVREVESAEARKELQPH